MPSRHSYEVALSFAGEDRSNAEALADALHRRGVKVFYDEFAKADLWGKDLYSHLSELYSKQAKYCVVFISKHYSTNPWPKLERKASQARALNQDEEYILPIRLDESEIPGILSTTGYLRWPPENAESIADKLMVKLEKWPNAALLSLYKARQKVQELANQWPQTAELLTAGTLRTLYMKRFDYAPSEIEAKVIFQNLLLRGRGTYHDQRTIRDDSPTAEASPGSLGWFWFTNIVKEKVFQYVQQAVSHPNIDVCAGALRAIGRLGGYDNISLLKEKINEGNPRIAAETIRAVGNLGTESDIANLREFQNDSRTEVLEALADSFAQRGSRSDVPMILSLMCSKNAMVRRSAARALGFIGSTSEILRLNAIAEDSDEHGQVRAAARKASKRITGNLFEQNEGYHERLVRKAAQKYELSNVYNDSTRDKAWSIVERSPEFPAWDAAVRWIVSHEPEGRITNMIAKLASGLRFRVLQDLDYRLYCPEWWRNPMDERVP